MKEIIYVAAVLTIAGIGAAFADQRCVPGEQSCFAPPYSSVWTAWMCASYKDKDVCGMPKKGPEVDGPSKGFSCAWVNGACQPK